MQWLLPLLAIALAGCLIDLVFRHRRALGQIRTLQEKNCEAFDELVLLEDKILLLRARESDHQQIVTAQDQVLEEIRAERDSLERRFWEIHGVVEQVLLERDGWKACFRTQVGEHLEGQAVLEQKIVQLRSHLNRAIATLHGYQRRADPNATLIKGPADLDPLDGPPVGTAERYYERMKTMLMTTAPSTFDALMRRDQLAAGLERPPLPGAPKAPCDKNKALAAKNKALAADCDTHPAEVDA